MRLLRRQLPGSSAAVDLLQVEQQAFTSVAVVLELQESKAVPELQREIDFWQQRFPWLPLVVSGRPVDFKKSQAWQQQGVLRTFTTAEQPLIEPYMKAWQRRWQAQRTVVFPELRGKLKLLAAVLQKYAGKPVPTSTIREALGTDSARHNLTNVYLHKFRRFLEEYHPQWQLQRQGGFGYKLLMRDN